jgi:hypothetical protein
MNLRQFYTFKDRQYPQNKAYDQNKDCPDKGIHIELNGDDIQNTNDQSNRGIK